MRTVGIICECNPFHGGHQYLIKRARAAGDACVICVMSGCFVQRGEPALSDPHSRAKALLAGGADAVLELPFPYAAASAERFADAGVAILSSVGVEELWFGSECGDLLQLKALAKAAEDPELQRAYAVETRDGEGTAERYFRLLSARVGGDVSCASNDILAIAYLRALLRRGSKLCPVTVKREGAAYTDRTLREGEYPSATALREAIKRDGLAAVRPWLLPETAESLAQAVAHGLAPADREHAAELFLGRAALADPEEVERIAELSGGLGRRLCEQAKRARSVEELIEATVTKKYTRVRVMRGLLFLVTGVTGECFADTPAYTRLLAANGRGREALEGTHSTNNIPIVTRRTELASLSEEARARARLQELYEERAYRLFTLCLPSPVAGDGLWRTPPVILP